MTNPLSPDELAACWTARQDYLDSEHDDSLATFMFTRGIDYLRAELAQEEPDLWKVVSASGRNVYYCDEDPRPSNMESGGTVTEFYLRPSEPSKIATDMVEWLQNKRHAWGAVNGCHYASGVEYGLRLAEIELSNRVKPSTSKEKDHG